jgi:hypothetical protein
MMSEAMVQRIIKESIMDENINTQEDWITLDHVQRSLVDTIDELNKLSDGTSGAIITSAFIADVETFEHSSPIVKKAIRSFRLPLVKAMARQEARVIAQGMTRDESKKIIDAARKEAGEIRDAAIRQGKEDLWKQIRGLDNLADIIPFRAFKGRWLSASEAAQMMSDNINARLGK